MMNKLTPVSPIANVPAPAAVFPSEHTSRISSRQAPVRAARAERLDQSVPRPLPRFFQEQLSFSTKKEKGTPKDSLPPRPPVKSAPPVSRIFPGSQTGSAAKAISFKAPHISNQTISPLYNERSRELYFDQCFQIDSVLGTGSFGEVFKVKSKEDGRFYAVKRSRDRFKGEQDRRRKLEEVAKHEKLRRHPNCVRFYKAWEERRHLYIQTELCRTSLKNLADQNHDIPEALILNYVVDLLMAIKHLHDSDLVHMDIKPENIFISDCNVCKLGDFGLVIDLSTETDFSEAQEGDPKYLAPEILQGKYGKPADLFSLGITLLELASDLDLPRGGDLWHQLRQKKIPPRLLHDLSPCLSRIVLLMLEPDPQIRPSVEQLLQEPVIKKMWKKRKRQQVFRNLSEILKSWLHHVWRWLCLLCVFLVCPVNYFRPTKKVCTPTKSSLPTHPPDWDRSFSEDEISHNDSLLLDTSLCAPLDFSSSSEDSFREETSLHTSVLPMGTRFLSSERTAQHESSTPSINCHRSLIQDLNKEPLLPLSTAEDTRIEPKNLMDAFNEASSSDED